MQGLPAGSSAKVKQSPTTEQQQLAETQKALQDALDQLEELAATNDSVGSLHDQMLQDQHACLRLSSSANIRCFACHRYEELEGALASAEQHLNDSEQQDAIQHLQHQVEQLQTQLQEGSAVAQQLRERLEGAKSARQRAADELFAAAQAHQELQVS